MGTGPRSQSLRVPRSSYGKLQEPWGRPQEGKLRRALSLKQGREKSGRQGLNGGVEREKSRLQVLSRGVEGLGGAEGLDCSSPEQLQGSLEDTQQLIQAQRGGSRRWLRQYQKVRRRWDSFVASFPGVTLSRPASPEPPLHSTS